MPPARKLGRERDNLFRAGGAVSFSRFAASACAGVNSMTIIIISGEGVERERGELENVRVSLARGRRE